MNIDDINEETFADDDLGPLSPYEEFDYSSKAMAMDADLRSNFTNKQTTAPVLGVDDGVDEFAVVELEGRVADFVLDDERDESLKVPQKPEQTKYSIPSIPSSYESHEHLEARLITQAVQRPASPAHNGGRPPSQWNQRQDVLPPHYSHMLPHGQVQQRNGGPRPFHQQLQQVPPGHPFSPQIPHMRPHSQGGHQFQMRPGQFQHPGHLFMQGAQPVQAQKVPQTAPSQPTQTSSGFQRPQPFFNNWRVPLPNQNFQYMDKFEIENVLHRQLTALQSADPVADDFYFQVFNARKGTENRNDVVIGPALRYSTRNRREDGSVILPEGTLGRLAASTLRAPKVLMNLGRFKSQETSNKTLSNYESPGIEEITLDAEIEEDINEDVGPRRLNCFDGLTMVYLIEEAIRCLMHVEDVDAHLINYHPEDPNPLVINERHTLSSERVSLLAQLSDSLDLSRTQQLHEYADHVILKFVDLPLGRLLLYRALLVLGPQKCDLVVTLLLIKPQSFLFPAKKHACDSDFTSKIGAVLFQMPLSSLTVCFGTFLGSQVDIKAVVRTKRGCELLRFFVDRYRHASNQLGGPEFAQQTASLKGLFGQFATDMIKEPLALFEGLIDNEPIEETNESISVSMVERGFANVYEESQEQAILAPEKPEFVKRGALWDFIATVASLVSHDSQPYFIQRLSGLLKQELGAIIAVRGAMAQQPSSLQYLYGLCVRLRTL